LIDDKVGEDEETYKEYFVANKVTSQNNLKNGI
jgi:hypothetical protein